jgi:hypothetical protein
VVAIHHRRDDTAYPALVLFIVTHLHILFVASHNTTSVQSANSSCIRTAYAPRQEVTAGMIEPYLTMMNDVILYFRVMFASTTFFWLTLSSVKLSLLALYKKMMEGLQGIYMKLWWAVFGFRIVVSPAWCIRSTLTNAMSRAWSAASSLTWRLAPTLGGF